MTSQPAGDPPSPIETVATFWAHYDDDLIFASPTLLHALDRGHRIRSFFFTGSDAGKGASDYATGREVGIRAAYDTMLGSSARWSNRTVVLGNGVTVTVTRPDGDDRVALTFLRLPDGGLRGGGYETTGWESLPKLLAGELSSIRTIDTGQEITLDQLRSTVVELVAEYDATVVLSNLPGFAEGADGDHPDHQTVGRIVAAVVDDGLLDAGLVRYAIGYPGAQRPANIAPDLQRKLEVFASYGAHDAVVARDEVSEYLHVRGFGEWLQREYLVPHRELVRIED